MRQYKVVIDTAGESYRYADPIRKILLERYGQKRFVMTECPLLGAEDIKKAFAEAATCARNRAVTLRAHHPGGELFVGFAKFQWWNGLPWEITIVCTADTGGPISGSLILPVKNIGELHKFKSEVGGYLREHVHNKPLYEPQDQKIVRLALHLHDNLANYDFLGPPPTMN